MRAYWCRARPVNQSTVFSSYNIKNVLGRSCSLYCFLPGPLRFIGIHRTKANPAEWSTCFGAACFVIVAVHNYVIECFVWSTLYPCGMCSYVWILGRWDEKRGRQNVQIFVPTEPWALPQKLGGEMQNESCGTFTKQNVYGILSGLHIFSHSELVTVCRIWAWLSLLHTVCPWLNKRSFEPFFVWMSVITIAKWITKSLQKLNKAISSCCVTYC